MRISVICRNSTTIILKVPAVSEHRTRSNLQVGAKVLGDVGTVALTQHRDLLLDVLDLILGLLQVDGLYGHYALTAIVDAFEHLHGAAER